MAMKGGNPKNLKPRKKGDPKTPGTGRPEGSRNFQTVMRELLRKRDSQTGMLGVELLALKSFQRAVKRGGHDLQTILDRVEGPVAQVPTAENYTEEEMKRIAEININRARRENGKT